MLARQADQAQEDGRENRLSCQQKPIGDPESNPIEFEWEILVPQNRSHRHE